MNKVKGIFILLLMFWIWFGLTLPIGWSYVITYLAHKSDIGLNYKDKKVIPLLIDPTYSSYKYSISIDGKSNDAYLKAILIGKNKDPLTEVFSISKGNDVVMVWNNTIKKYKEIYLLLEYYSPSSKNTIKKVDVDVYPILTSSNVSNKKVNPHPQIIPTIHYDFNVHLNAYLPSFSNEGNEEIIDNSISTSNSNTNPLTSSNTGSNTQESSQKNALSKKDISSSNSSSSNLTHPSNFSLENKNENIASDNHNITNKELLNNTSLPTGKVVGTSSNSSLTTYLILIIGVLVLYGLWKVL